MKYEDSIMKTKEEFEKSFKENDFYNKQTQDDIHLNKIISFLPIKDKMRILDLGTGSGYLAFNLARKYPNVLITGLDIVNEALIINSKKRDEEKLDNLIFINYDGFKFPFPDGSFDMVISRYAIHHFPDICSSIKEVNRVLRKDGYFFISDPTINEVDNIRFIDSYMQLKHDGHIKFYTLEELISINKKNNLIYVNDFKSSIRFPKQKSTANGYKELIESYPKEIINSYDLAYSSDSIYVTEKVNNVLFKKIDIKYF